MPNKTEVLIIGAGLAGLSAAIHLQNAGVESIVVEASDRVGGRVASDVIDGFICDRGFQLINSLYPALLELDVIREIDFVAAPRIIEVALGESRYALGDPRKAPFTALNSATGSIREKLALLSYIIRPPHPHKSVGDELRVSGNVYTKVLRPFLKGVFLTDPDDVDSVYGHSIVKSFVRGNPGIPRKGVGQLSNALASRINQIKLNTAVERLEGKLVHTNNGTYLADKIIIATDATRATQLLDLKEVPRMAGCITWYHSTDVNPSGSGRLVIDGENRGPIFNTVVMSDISKAYSPQGKHLISTTTSLNVTESDVRRHLSTLWQTNTHSWQLIAKYEIPAALPIHKVGRALSQPIKISDTYFVAGDHRTVPSQQGALFSGRLAAQLVLD